MGPTLLFWMFAKGVSMCAYPKNTAAICFTAPVLCFNYIHRKRGYKIGEIPYVYLFCQYPQQTHSLKHADDERCTVN